jgi:protein-disulfide isomerase
MRHRLWQNQSTWKKADDAARLVRGWAAEAGLDMTGYDACMGEDRPAERIEAGRELARQLGVRGTPTFFILGYPPLPGALPTETFRKVLTLAYEDATGQGK